MRCLFFHWEQDILSNEVFVWRIVYYKHDYICFKFPCRKLNCGCIVNVKLLKNEWFDKTCHDKMQVSTFRYRYQNRIVNLWSPDGRTFVQVSTITSIKSILLNSSQTRATRKRALFKIFSRKNAKYSQVCPWPWYLTLKINMFYWSFHGGQYMYWVWSKLLAHSMVGSYRVHTHLLIPSDLI